MAPRVSVILAPSTDSPHPDQDADDATEAGQHDGLDAELSEHRAAGGADRLFVSRGIQASAGSSLGSG